MLQYEVRSNNLKQAQRAFRQFYAAIQQGRKEPMELVAKEAVKIINERTASGKDVSGRRFQKYSPAYAKKKKTNHVDLTLTRQMLNAVSFQAWAKKARIFIKGTGELIKKAIVHNNGGRSGRGTGFQMPQREFMGVEQEKERIVKIARKWWYDYAKKFGFGK